MNRFPLVLLAGGLLAACAHTPVPEGAKSDVPTDWQGPLESDAQVWPDLDWWTNFNSPELLSIIEQVKANNFDYANNVRNLRRAEIQLEQAGVDLWPSPNLSISTGASASRANLANGTSTSGGQANDFSLSASASMSNILNKPLSYQLAVNNYESQLAQSANTAMSTLRTAAQTYFQLLYTRDQIKVTEQNLDNARQILNFAQARVNAGVAIPIDLLNQQISVKNSENSLQQQQQQDFQLRATLALLTGRGVSGFDVEGQTLADIDVPSVQPGLPSELLTRRPDIVQAELNLKNSAISVDQARLAFFPSISLNGSANASSSALLNVLADPASTTVNLSTSLAETLLGNGNRKRNLETSRLSLESSLASYRKSVISAFNDIEVELNNIQLTKQQGDVAQQNLESATEQFRLASLRYMEGTANYQTVLTAQDTLARARSSLQSNRQAQLNNILTLYIALGGGWESGEVLLKQPEYAQAN